MNINTASSKFNYCGVVCVLLTIIVLLQGCAMTYEMPTERQQVFQVSHNANKTAVFSKIERFLASKGFQISKSNEQSGIISTALMNYRMTTSMADCGTTMGIDYLKDNRTKTELAINVIVDDVYLQMTSNIHGEYKPGTGSQDITLSCVSRGFIERELLDEIKGQYLSYR